MGDAVKKLISKRPAFAAYVAALFVLATTVVSDAHVASTLRTPARTRPAVLPTFDVAFGESRGVAALSDSLTVDGSTLTPDVSCDFTNTSPNTGVTCGTGGAFSVASSGTSLDVVRAPAPGEGAVRFNGGTVLQTASTTLGDVTTQDVVYEMVVKTNTTSFHGIVGKKSGDNTTGAGWYFATFNNGASISLFQSDGTTQASPTVAMTASTWMHLMCFTNRDWNNASGTLCYANGAAGTGANPTTVAGSFTNSQQITFGSLSNAINQKATNVAVAGFRLWKCSGCLAASTTDWARVAKERAAAYFGAFPTTYAGSPTPTTMTSSARYCPISDGVTTQLFYLGANAPCVGNMRDANGALRRGYLSEPSTTNLILQSQTLPTSWTAFNASITSDATTAPDGTTTADALIPDTTSVNPHAYGQTISMTSGTTYTVSAWMKAAGSRYGGIYTTAASNGMMFDLSTCSVGTKRDANSGITSSRAQDYGNGWCRVEITFAAASTTGHTTTFRSSNADWLGNGSDTSIYTGDGVTPALYVWGAQVEAQPTATSYVATTTASASRSSYDILTNTASGNADVTKANTIDLIAWTPNYDTNSVATHALWIGGSDGFTDGVAFNFSSSDAASIVVYSNPSGAVVSTVGSADVSDGLSHAYRSAHTSATAHSYYIDGSLIGTDNAAAFPTASSLIQYGGAPFGGRTSYALIERVTAYSAAYAPGALAPSLSIEGVQQ